MASIGHHLMRRAFDATQDHFSSPTAINPADEGQDDTEIKRLAVWAVALIWATFILYMAMMSAVRPMPSHTHSIRQQG